MRSWGIWCMILGIGSFVLPYFNLQFVLLDIFGPAQSIVGLLLALIGVVLIGLSFVRKGPS